MIFCIEGNTLILKGVLDIDHAQELKMVFMSFLEMESMELILDGAEVERVDFSILQLLFSAWITFKQSGKKLTLKNPSQIMVQRNQELGSFPPF